MSAASVKRVYFFGDGEAEGSASMKDLLGGKGANLAEMNLLGLPVPPGFTITTETCHEYFAAGGFPEGLEAEVDEALRRVERVMGLAFGDPERPLLVSVRSGAPVSMPGMMDTVLNLGLNDEIVEQLAERAGERFAWDSYRRLVAMYGDVVLGLKPEEKGGHDPFQRIIDELKAERDVELDTELTVDDLKELVRRFKQAILDGTGQPFPQDPRVQLWGAIRAVFDSWNNDRAIKYREMNGIPETMGTAVNVQAMVFGNMGEDCATGVGFTRDPATGEKPVDPLRGRRSLYGEYLVNAQGEDVVAGIRTPQRITLEGSRAWASERGISEEERRERYPSLEELMPEVYEQLLDIVDKLEAHYRDMQDIEFTIQNGKLWMLQTRTGKRTALAALRMAVEMVDEGLIDRETALLRFKDPNDLTQLLRPTFDESARQAALDGGRLLARGLEAGPGAAVGRVVFSPDRAEAYHEAAKRGERVDGKDWGRMILVRIETSPEDLRGMAVAEGILTARGGMTSHAALVARQLGKTCVAGCSALDIDYERRELRVGETVLREGDVISLDGTRGHVILGEVPTQPSEIVRVLVDRSLSPEDSYTYRLFERFMGWADELRRLRVRTNADQPAQAATARAFGAEGIGLCRTEHMFFEGDRIDAVRRMILAPDAEGRKKALDEILPMQREDFEGIFEAMDGFPVTIRTLDPPLHEFLPHEDEEIRALAPTLGVSFEELKAKVEELAEANPMLGHRGCRLGITYPEITAMQARAIFEAAVNSIRRGIRVFPEVMIPLVGHVRELAAQKRIVVETAEAVMAETGVRFDYMVGTMIELPRAALTADEIAQEAEFFSFGTNDLTQTTFGISRDDMGSFVPEYRRLGIYEQDPFQVLDRKGVGELLRIGVTKGRKTRGDLEVGICGEHGGEPSSVEFCHGLGFDYVSCSAFRVPIARLAAAHAVIKERAGA